MALLHETGTRSSIEQRLGKLQASTRAAWGKMSAAQMLWHVNQAMAAAMGQAEIDPARPPLPRPLMKFLVLNMPWVKNAPTNKAFVAREECDFNAEMTRCRQLIAEVASRPLDAAPQDHPMFGAMTVSDSSRLHARHLDHHLKQFGL